MQDITALLTRENYNKGKGHSIFKLGVLIIFTSALLVNVPLVINELVNPTQN